MGVVGRFEALLPKIPELDPFSLAVACGLIIPILLFGFVLYPSRKFVDRLASQSEEMPEGVLYVDPKKLSSAEALEEAACRCDPIKEVSFELLRVSQLRDLKRRRFLRALVAAAIAFLCIFATHFIRVYE